MAHEPRDLAAERRNREHQAAKEARLRGLTPNQIICRGLNELCTTVDDIETGLERVGTAEAKKVAAYYRECLGYLITVAASIVLPPPEDDE